MNQADIYFKDLDPNKPYILFAGGCGEFGMNVTLYIFQEKLYVVDCGVAFAPDHEIGIDSHVPDLDEIFEYFGGPSAYLITHGHEDHVGALPLVLENWPAPVYLTKWTHLIFKDRIEKFGSRIEPEVTVVAPGDVVKTKDIEVEWFHVPHSIPGCCSLVMKFDEFKIFHSGDFKMDPHPPIEKGPDLERLKAIAPMDVLITDSTNSQSAGMCPSENQVLEPLCDLIAKCPNMVVVTTFASNLWRLLTIVSIAKKLNKKLFFSGTSLFKTLDYATEMGYFDPDESLILDDDGMRTADRSNLIVVASGSQESLDLDCDASSWESIKRFHCTPEIT